MASVFCYHPSNETLDAFNERVAEFCQENDVVNLVVSGTGSGVMLSLLEPEDLPACPPLVLLPVVYPFTAEEAPSLEKIVSGYMSDIQAQNTDTDVSLPLQAQTVMRTDGTGGGYVVLMVCIGELDDSAIGGEGEPS